MAKRGDEDGVRHGLLLLVAEETQRPIQPRADLVDVALLRATKWYSQFIKPMQVVSHAYSYLTPADFFFNESKRTLVPIVF